MKKYYLILISLLLGLTLAHGLAYAEITNSYNDNGEENSDAEVTPTPAPDSTPQPNEELQETPAPNTDEEEKQEEQSNINTNNNSPGAAGGIGFSGSKFPDCNGHWAENIIIECTEKKYLDGYDDGNFYPDNPVNAAEFAKIFSAWTGNFYIITDGNWAIPYIRSMLTENLYDIDDFKDYYAPMTREQIAKAVMKSVKNEYFPSDLTKYSELIHDIDNTDEEYREYVTKAYTKGIMSGYDDNTFGAKENVTRAEVLTIIDRTKNVSKRVVPEKVLEVTSNDSQTELTIYGSQAQVEGGMLNIFGESEESYIENFRTQQKIIFDFYSGLYGKCKMKVYYAANLNSGGGTATFNLNGNSFDHTFAQTGSWTTYVYEDLGEVELKKGVNSLIITDKEIPNTYLINIKHIIFEKAE